tara:strand:+ start:133 stop:321 length:189 start_codon:yes stop_codon:yes gene_type:complete
MKKFLIIFFILSIHFDLSANEKKDLKNTTSISNQLKTLQDLYKSGVISGYEYEKEKKKILKK